MCPPDPLILHPNLTHPAMKKLLTLLLIIGCFATPALADTNKAELGDTTLLRKNPPPVGGSLRIPANPNIGILCTYGRGWLKLDLPRGVYSATVTLTSATYQWNGLATTEQPYTEIPELEGRYTIILRTDDNQTYSGSIEF